MCSHANLLIRIEVHTYLAVLDFRVCLQIGHGRHDFSYASLVVCPQEGIAVRDDDVLADVVLQLGKLPHCGYDALLLVQYDVRTVIVLDDAGAHVLAAAVRRGVHVGDEANGGNLLGGIGRQGGIDVGVFVHLHLFQAQTLQFLLQVACQVKLLLAAGTLVLAGFVRLRVETHVFQKPFD